MAYNSKKRRETKKVKSQGGQVIHTGDVTSSGAVAPHRQREDSDLRRQSFRDLVQQESGIGGGMTSGYGGFHPVYLSDRKMDAQGAQGYISAKAEPGKQYIQQHPQQNWNPYAPKQPQQPVGNTGYMQWGTAQSPEFNALAELAKTAGEARSKTYAEYMQERRDALKRDQALNLPGFGMRYPSIAAQEYGRQLAGGELEEDRDYIRRKWAANQADPSDATRPGGVTAGDRIFKGRGVLARDDRTLQNALMTDEQRQTYYYIYGTQGREEAERFRDTVMDTATNSAIGDPQKKLHRSINQQIAEKAYEVGGKHAEGIPRLIGNTAAGAVGAADRALDNIAGVKDVVTGNPQYRPTSTAGFYADTVQRDAPEGSAERMLYELSQTAATNAPAYLAGIAGGPAVGRTVFAIQAGASAYNESLKEGHTVGEATAYGAMQALDEEITGWLLGGLAGMSGGVAQKAIGRSAVGQMVSQTLQGLMQTEGGKYLMRQLMEAFGNGMGEAAQEYLQHFTEQFEQWIAYNHDNYTITTPEGRQNLAAAAPTLEEAKKALLDPQALHEALLGFLNAGLMNAPGQALEAADIASRGRNSTIGVQGYGEFADSIDVNPLHYSNPDTYQAARDLRGIANEYAARNTAGMPTSTFDRGIIDRAAEEFADRAAQDPRQLARTAYDAGDLETAPAAEGRREAEQQTAEQTAPKATREAERTPPAEESEKKAEPEEAPAPEEGPRRQSFESFTPAEGSAADIDAEINLRRQQAEQARGRQRRIAEGLDTPSYHAAETPTLEGLAQVAGEQQAATKGAQRQAIVDAAQNLDADSLAGVMGGATMLTEAEKQAAYQEGKTAAVTQMRMEAQNGGEERANVPGEGSERNVSLRTGERTGRVSQTAGRTAEGWKDWNRTADTGIHGSDITVSAGISAEKVIRTAEPGQTVHVVERGGSPSMRKSAAMIRHYDQKMKVTPFVSRGDIRVKGGETARAFSDPLTRTIGYRANDENAPGEELARHELIEFGIIDGKVDPAEAVRHLSDEVRKHTGGNIVGIVSELYARGSIANFDSLPAVQKAAALRHANKEMICDIGAGINQFRGVKGAEMVADLVDAMNEILGPYMNERLGGAFDAEADASDSEALEDAGIIINESGTVAHMGYSTRYSWKTDEEIEKAVKALQESLGVSKKKAQAFVESERSLTNLILSPGNVAAMDYTPDDRYKAIKKNSDYPQGTVDFNNNCRKRIPFTSVFNRLQMRNPSRVFTAEDLEIIRQTLIKDDVAVACALCYVEERRQRLGEIAEGFVNLYSNGALLESFAGKREYNKLKAALEKVGDDSYQPNIYDLITYDGLKALDEAHHGIAEAFRIYNNARGMQSGRLIEGRAEYKRELLKYTDDQVKRINDLGGLRIFSYSDFEAVNLLDLVQIIQDAAVRGIKIQAYTKVPAFARVVRNTGIKLNRSLIAAGNGVKYVDGKAELDLDPVEGININDPDFFDSTDDRDIGNVLVGMSDEQIRLAMTSPLVDYIIPFHTSLPKTILKAKGIDHWTNYKLSQTDRDMRTGNNAKNINIYTDVLQAAKDEGKPIRTKRQFVEKFLQVAKERNLIPRFSQFLNVDANGNYVYTEGYHKFLIDFKLFDKNGRIIEQEVVRPEFDDAYNTKLMEDFAKGAGTSAVTNGIYNDVVDALNEQSRGTEVQHSSKLNIQLDEEYMKAVNSGNIDKAREMVESAAADAGFTNAIPEQTLAYKVRTGKAPQKTMKVYKVFTVAPDGAPTALFVSGTQKLPQGVWLDAQDTWHFTAANGEQYVPSTQNPYTEGGKTGGSVEIPSEEIRQELIRRGFLPEGSRAKKVTALAYRPGWHAGDLPFFPQGGMQDKAYAEKETEYGDIWKKIRKEEGVSENKAKRLRRERYGTFDEWRGSENVAAHPYKNIHRYNQVVFECEIAFDHDYTRSEVIQKNGENKGKVQFFDMQEMPVDGGYKFATNPMANANDIGSWYISGSLKIGKALTQEECDAILKENGRTPQFWEQGEMDLESLGYTGQQYEAARKTLAPVTYDDDGNVIPLSKRFDPEVDDVRYSSKLNLSEAGPTFYSKLQREVQNFKGEKIGAASVESYLKGKGVKDEEIKWSGIRTYLEGKKSVDKAELLQFLRDNEMQIEETVLGGENEWYDDLNATEFKSREDAIAAIDDYVEWFNEEVGEDEAITKDDLVIETTNDRILVKHDHETIIDARLHDGTNWSEYKLDGGENYREILFSVPGSDYSNQAMRTHWNDRSGVLAHARVQDFNTENGEKVLFVEEIQSDWHNAGQKKGYAPDLMDSKGSEILNEIRTSNEFDAIAKQIAQNKFGDTSVKSVSQAKKRISELFRQYAEADSSALESKIAEEVGVKRLSRDQADTVMEYNSYLMDAIGTDYATPDAPFRTTYTDYVLKNLLRMAAEGDYDYLAWTTGKMQEERWSDEFAEGYRIEYDQQIPKFLKKYGKQWGAGLQEIPMYSSETGEVRDVPAIVVNDTMKESVLYEGQPMFASKLNLTDAMLADLVTKYGALPKGENAKANIELPKQTSSNKNTRRFARNVLESGVANAQASDAIKEMIIKEALSYEPKTDKTAAEYAASTIRAGGVERARNEWDRAVKNGKIEKEDMALGQFLLKEYAKAGDTDKVLEMTEEISAIATRFGQNIQALRLLKKYSMQDPAVGLGYIQRTVDQMNREAKRKMGNKYKEMKIDKRLANEYINAKTSDQIDAALGKIYVNLGSQVQKTTGEEIADRLRAWRYLSMLGNSRTHIRNLVGNAIFVPAVRMKDAIGAELEKSTGASRTKALRATPESVAFAKKDAILMRDVLSGKTDMSIRDLIMEQRKVFSTNFLNKASKGNSELLEKEDWWFLRMHYVNALSKYITANNIDPNTIDGRDLSRAREYAIKEAQKATYRDANRFASWLNSGTKISEPAKFMIEGMMPFKKTPANILRRGVEYSPAGLIATATKGTLDLRAGKLDLNEYIDRFSAGLTGSAVFGLGMFLASTGLILGGYADDDDKTRRKLRGEQEYSVRIGDHTYTVDWAAPGSLPLFVGVETMCALMQQDITFSDIPEMTLRVIDPMINMSMLDGLNNTLEAISYSDHKLSAIVMENLYSLLGQFVPTIMGQGARIIDTTQRINYQDKNLGVSKDMLYFFEKIQNKIPFMSFKNDPYLNEFGQENVTESRFVAAFQNLVSPGYISKINDDKVIKELDRLSEAQEENVYPKKMDKYVGSGKDRKDLTSAEYTTYQRIAGQLSYNILDNMVDDKRYDSLTADQQAEAIKMAYSYAKAVGRIAIQKDYEEKLKGDNKKIYNAAKDNALQAYDVILDLVTK